jgi:Na+/melibiose symporter-like transporter
MLSQKVMFGLGTFFAGLIIEYVGIAGVTEISEVTPQMFQRLGWIYGPGLCLFTLAGAWVFSFYRLDRQRLEAVQLELRATRSAAGAIL